MGTHISDSTEVHILENLLDLHLIQKTSLALSTLLGEPVSHILKQTRDGTATIRYVKDMGKDTIVCSVFLYGIGDVRLGILYVIPECDAKYIAGKLLCLDKIDSLDSISKSAISEVGNILSGSFFNTLSDHTGFKIELSTPNFVMTSISDFSYDNIAQFLQPDDDILTEIEFSSRKSGVRLHMLIIQDHDNVRKLLNYKMVT
ncbi:MAG: chemotaxis protein CheC [Nitrososphaera sp.]|jgi:chemotaxis protein CheC